MRATQNSCFRLKACTIYLTVNLFIVVCFLLPWDNEDTTKISIKWLRAGESHGGTSVLDNDTNFNVNETMAPESDQAVYAISEATNSDHSSDKLSGDMLFRIQLKEEGRCLGVSEEKDLVVKFCNPRDNDSFSHQNGKLKSEELKLCIGLNQPNPILLAFMDCEKAVRLELFNNFLLQSESGNESEAKLCLSALDGSEDSVWKPTNSPKLGAKVGLVECEETVSSVEILEETSFRLDRAALLRPLPAICNFAPCGVNRPPPPVVALPSDKISRCLNLMQCVTVVTKTARRPLFVIRLARVLRELLHIDLPMIVIDDGPSGYSTEIMNEISKFPNLKYVIVDSPDVGIAEGRNMGLQMVATKYFLILDDDIVVTNRTNIWKLVEILDTTDATLVGGRLSTGSSFAGFLRIYKYKRIPTLFHAVGSCMAAHKSIPGFPDCVRCDITTNIFLAKTQDAIDAGGWSRELKISEHKDFFLRLKAMGRKVVYCPAFQAINEGDSAEIDFYGESRSAYNKCAYTALRSTRKDLMAKKFHNRWNILRTIRTSTKKPGWINEIG